MREHGALRRILLIYREAIRRISGGDQAPFQELRTGACLVRGFVEDYHERLEERYVFPRLVQAGELAETVSILVTQHQRGRVLTDQILEFASGETDDSSGLTTALTAFIRMYEPHAAREDTVVFPAFREAVSPGELLELGEIFEDEEKRRFGESGFPGIVAEVAEAEKALGIYHLSRFTPRA